MIITAPLKQIICDSILKTLWPGETKKRSENLFNYSNLVDDIRLIIPTVLFSSIPYTTTTTFSNKAITYTL